MPLWASRCERLPFLPPERESRLPSLGNPRSISSHCPPRLHLSSPNRRAKPGSSAWHLHRLGHSMIGPGGSVTREESLSLRKRLWNRCQNWRRPDENPTNSLAVSPIVCAVGLFSWLERVPHGEGKRTGDEEESADFPCHRDTFPREEYGTTGSAPEARSPQQPSRCANTRSLILPNRRKTATRVRMSISSRALLHKIIQPVKRSFSWGEIRFGNFSWSASCYVCVGDAS